MGVVSSPTIASVGITAYRFFVISQLILAIYVSLNAIKGWDESPVVVSVDTESISQVKFPAVTICHPITWTWASIAELLNHLDEDQKIITKHVSQNVEVLDPHIAWYSNLKPTPLSPDLLGTPVTYQKRLQTYEVHLANMINDEFEGKFQDGAALIFFALYSMETMQLDLEDAKKTSLYPSPCDPPQNLDKTPAKIPVRTPFPPFPLPPERSTQAPPPERAPPAPPPERAPPAPSPERAPPAPPPERGPSPPPITPKSQERLEYSPLMEAKLTLIRKFYQSFLISGAESLESALPDLCDDRQRLGDICCYTNEPILDMVKEWASVIENTKENEGSQIDRYCSTDVSSQRLKKWCEKCTEAKGGFRLGVGNRLGTLSTACIENTDLLRQELLPLLIMQHHPLEYPIENLPKLFISWAVIGSPQCLPNQPGNCDLTPDSDKIKEMNDYIDDVEDATGIHALKFWYFLNRPYISQSFVDTFHKHFRGFNLAEDMTADMYSIEQINSVLSSVHQPKIHGDYNKEMVLIPFCSFGSKILQNCTEFKEVETTFAQDKKCYSFNYDGQHYGKGITPNTGLVFAGNVHQ